MATKRRVIHIAFLVGILAAIGRAAYLTVFTYGFAEHQFTMIYGLTWQRDLPLSVLLWGLFGFLAVTSWGFLRGSKSFTEKI